MALEALFNNIAAAIHEKDGKTDGIVAEDFPARIRVIPDRPVTASPKDVNFFDYNGTLVYSYTLPEAQALTALPKGPAHDGLVFQGWNWPLEEVKALTRPMNVGAMYTTDDGKTRLKIRVWDTARSNVPLYISQTVSNGVTIDWGDGSISETLDGTGYINTHHQYMSEGDYIITLSVEDGCNLSFGNGTGNYCVLGPVSNTSPPYYSLLHEANIGDGVIDIELGAFRNCLSLKKVSIPNSVTNIKDRVFQACYSLKSINIPIGIVWIGSSCFNSDYSLESITIPNGVTAISSAFNACYSLSCITLPDSITRIDSESFRNCRSLVGIIIPEGVTSIGTYAFYNCFGIAEYRLKPTVPPTLVNVSAFEGIPEYCIIYVPAGSLEAYQTAENWSTYADYMREEQE